MWNLHRPSSARILRHWNSIPGTTALASRAWPTTSRTRIETLLQRTLDLLGDAPTL
ncbi:hypothetical protein [Rhodococcoides fascians]|uniref:hypothetical protein n=1 Tax=Rhodococcoides fascians TaxID=1828 RepID=UPI000AE89974|nr:MULTISPECIES: hypothetical protein [Rhodococcus]